MQVGHGISLIFCQFYGIFSTLESTIFFSPDSGHPKIGFRVPHAYTDMTPLPMQKYYAEQTTAKKRY